MNKKGQALVEFIIILPIFLFMCLALLDYGLIVYNKNRMENVISDVVDMYKNKKSTDEIETFVDKEIDGNISLEQDNDYIDIKISKEYKFTTPGLNKVFGKDYKIKVERNVYYEY